MFFNEFDNYLIEVYNNLVIELVQCFGISFFCQIDYLAISVIKCDQRTRSQNQCIRSITY